MDLNAARKVLPELAGLNDQTALTVIHAQYYPDMDKAELASKLGVKLPEPKAPERSTMRAVGDLATQFGGGVVSGVRMMSDMFGADNAVSGGLRSAEEALRSLQSAAAQHDQQKVAAIMQEAEGKGWGEQIALGLKAAMVAPGAMMAQSLGTAVPTLATALIPGVGTAAAIGRMGAGAAVGAAQGAGNIKGVIYEDVKRELAKANPGMPPEEIEARAVQAQSFGGENAGQIALGGALGVAAGTTGMERAFSGLRHGVTKAPPGMMARMMAGGAAEAVPEFAQGGQEKYASNVAQAGQGLDVDPWSGVVAQGTMEAAAAVAPGAISGIPAPKLATTPGQDVANTIRAENVVPESGPMTRAANVATEVKAQQAEREIDASVQNTSLTGTSMAAMMAGQSDPLQGAMQAQADPVVNESLTAAAPAADQFPDATKMVPDQVAQDRNMAPDVIGRTLADQEDAPYSIWSEAKNDLEARGLTDTHHIVPASSVDRNLSGFLIARKGVEPVAQAETAAPDVTLTNEGKTAAPAVPETNFGNTAITPETGKPAGAEPMQGQAVTAESAEPVTQPATSGVPEAGAGATQPPQAAPDPVINDRYGVDHTPFSQGGKPFKSRKAVDLAKKLQPTMRVVKVDGGFALADKTPAQLAAQAKAAKRLGVARTGAADTPMSAHEFIAAEGGISKDAAADLGIEGNVRIGNRFLYAGQGKGLSIEQAAEKLHQAGYIQAQDHNEALNIIKRSVSSPQYTAEGWDRMAQADQQAKFEDFLAAQQDEPSDPFGPLTAEEMADTGYDERSEESQARIRALLEQVDAFGVDAESIIDDAVRSTQNATQQDYENAAITALTEAIERGNRDSSQDSGQEGSEAGRAAQDSGQLDTEGLTSYSADDIRQRQEAQDKADQERKQKEQEAERKAQADSQVDDFVLTGSDRAADVAAAHGQGGLFDAPATQAKDEPKAEENTPESRWARSTSTDRVGIARAGGILLRAAENVAKKAWADLDPVVQEKLTKGMKVDPALRPDTIESIAKGAAKQAERDAKNKDEFEAGAAEREAKELTTAEMIQKGRDDFAAGEDRQVAIARIPSWKSSDWVAGWNEAKADADAKADGKLVMPSEFPTAEVDASYSHISHSGTARARSDRDEFVNKVQSLYDEAKALAETDAQQAALDGAIKTYKDEYLAQTRSLAKVRAGTYSGYVAGRAKLNARQADSRNSALDKALERFVAWDKAAAPKVKNAVLAARTPEKIAQLQADEAAKKAEQQEKRHRKDLDFMAKVLAFKAGDTLKVGSMLVTKVTNDKEGYPLTLTIKAEDGSPLTDDKLNLATDVFGKRGAEGLRVGKEKIRALVDAVRAEQGTAPQPEAAAPATSPEAKPASKTPIYDAHNELIEQVVAGHATPEQFKASFESVLANADAIKAELTTKTKAELLRDGGAWVQMRYSNENKADIVDALYRSMVGDYALNQSIQYSMGKGAYEAAVRRFVEATDAQRLADFAKERAAAIEEIKAKRAAKAAALENPQTLDDYRGLMTAKMRAGMTRKEAYLALTAEQRVTFDELEAESTREARETRKRTQKTQVQAAGQTTGGEIVATKHTREGYDLFVVKLAERVSREDYGTLLSSAKKLGGWYSSFRGNGATPGFQFKDKANAEAFLKLAAGDTTEAQAQVEQRRDAFEDDRSQTAAERLTTMADKLEESADESLNADRKTNTERRARFANAAEAAARAEKAMAKTMRNIAQAITDGKAKFLDAVRTKTQVQMLADIVRTAKDSELRAKYPAYADMEKRRGEPPTVETADFAEFPTFTAFRSDLASLGRQLLEVDGTKKLGQQLMNVADDVSDAYLEFAKANLHNVTQAFSVHGNLMLSLPSRETAEKAIKRSGMTGRLIVLPVKRGENRIILSPSEAINRGVWKGDGDKRITLTQEAGQLLVQAIGRRANKQNRLSVPWQFESADTKLKALARMGIETPAEFRSAVREFIGLREQAQEADRVKMLERAMVGRKADGLDFFPTPQEAADAMVDAAEITPDMAVLEPSAGMGHLADRIRAAGAEPDVIEISAERRELLQEKGYHLAEYDDFLQMEPRKFFTYGDVFRAPDGVEGTMRGVGRMGSQRVRLEDAEGKRLGLYDRNELVGVRHMGTWSGYDRIIMNPPFSDRRDAAHVMHAYDLLKPGGRIVAIMGEGVFFGQDKKAEEFRAWFEERGGTSEKLAEGTFMDPSLPVTTGVNARMVVIDKPTTDAAGDAPSFSRYPQKEMAPSISGSGGVQFPKHGHITTGHAKSLSEKHLSGHRQAHPVVNTFSRSAPMRGLTVEAAQDVVDEMKATWTNAPEVVVVESMDDPLVPNSIRQRDAKMRSQGSAGEPEGFWHQGKAYIVAGALRSPGAVMRVLFHETLGHYGLRGVFGKELVPILQQLAVMRRGDVLAKAAEYGLATSLDRAREFVLRDQPELGGADLETAARTRLHSDTLEAAEEVLAELAQSKPEIGFVRRVIAVIRGFLRKHVPGLLQSMTMTDEDIIGQFIMPARAFVERGRKGQGQSAEQFSRTEAARSLALSDTAMSRGDGDVRFSRTMGANELAGQVRDKLNETFNHPGKLNWWHKSVGSQYNLAERNPAFKKVFDAAQDFINDVSYYATEAANMAPKILPKLETIKDLAKTAISAADNKAVAAPVFEGTLSWARDADGKPIRIEALEKSYENLTDNQKARMLLRKNVVSEAQLKDWKASKLDVYSGAIRNRFEATFLKAGVRWTDAELKSIFKLSDEQIGLYQEFRAATDASLDNMAKAQMLREAGKDVQGMRDAVMEAPDVDTAAMMVRETLLDMAKEDPDRADVLADAAAGVLDTAAKINELKEQGYAPLSRFGRFTVDVVVDGQREYFGLFESEGEANKMAAKMRMEFGAANVAQGTMSQKEFELFQGITPESLELFGNMMGLDSTGNEAQDKAFQTYLKLTKNNRSAMKRLIHRQGIAGYSEDVGRVLAAFVYANARQTSAALHIGQMDEAITAIPKGEGELKDHALALAKYIKEPREEAAALRGLLFAQYLGGSVASAMVNFTQPLTVSIPYLSQFGGLAKAGKAWAQAVSDMRKGAKLSTDLEAALKAAEEKGVVSPQEVHQLMAQARGAATLQSGDGTKLGDAKAMAANGWTRTALAWGKLFGYAEQVNRRSTFIAAYRLAVDQGMKEPGAFAEKAVNETQFVNNKANKMKFGRGAIGATLMTFKSYSINWLELMHRLSTQDGKEGKLAAAYMLGALFLVAGAGGLPFAEDAEDLIDALGQKMGYNFSTKKAKQDFLEDLFGKAGAQFVDRGLTGLPGVPIDVSGRMGMANLIPGTGFMLSKKSHGQDMKEALGPVGGLIEQMYDAIGKFTSGEIFGPEGMLATMAPKAIGNMIKGADMLDKGMYRDTKGAKVIDTTTGEALAKIAGFQPASVSQVQEANYINQRAKDFYNLKSQEIRAKWAMGIFESDPDKVAEARQDMEDWNADNPDQRMTANMPAIVKKVREMRKDKAQRIADTAPKAMRAQMRQDARELAGQ